MIRFWFWVCGFVKLSVASVTLISHDLADLVIISFRSEMTWSTVSCVNSSLGLSSSFILCKSMDAVFTYASQLMLVGSFRGRFLFISSPLLDKMSNNTWEDGMLEVISISKLVEIGQWSEKLLGSWWILNPLTLCTACSLAIHKSTCDLLPSLLYVKSPSKSLFPTFTLVVLIFAGLNFRGN